MSDEEVQQVAICFGTDTFACPLPNLTLTNQSYFSDACIITEEESSIPLGIALGVLGSFGINLGNNLQALGLNVQANELADHIALLEAKGYAAELDKGEGAKLPKMKKCTKGSAIFGVGWLIFVSASLINFAAFAFAPAALLAPLEAIQVVNQLFMGRLIFKKPISGLALGATGVTVLGVVGVVISVPPKVYNFSQPQLISLWEAPLWNVYLIFVLALSASAQVRPSSDPDPTPTPQPKPKLFIVPPPSPLQVVHLVYKKADAAGKPLPRSSAIMPVSYAIAAAIIGALSVAQAKVMSEMVSLLICGVNVFTEVTRPTPSPRPSPHPPSECSHLTAASISARPRPHASLACSHAVLAHPSPPPAPRTPIPPPP